MHGRVQCAIDLNDPIRWLNHVNYFLKKFIFKFVIEKNRGERLQLEKNSNREELVFVFLSLF